MYHKMNEDFEIIVKSMNKVFSVSYLTFTEEAHLHIFKSKMAVGVAQMPGLPEIGLTAPQYGSLPLKIEGGCANYAQYPDLFIKSGDVYFQVAAVVKSQSDVEQMLSTLPHTKKHCEMHVKCMGETLYFITSKSPALFRNLKKQPVN